jgi:hypothetical protein
LSARASHATQVDPALPQVASDRVSHVVPWQQPLGHDVASQVHRPETQRWPPAHAGPVPHAQVPFAPQWSALVGSQATQVPPPMLQVASDGTLHVDPWQQPAGHEDASQTQAPFMQCWPAWQGAVPPQRQAPVSEQVSALSASQVMHAAAPTPHVVTERG